MEDIKSEPLRLKYYIWSIVLGWTVIALLNLTFGIFQYKNKVQEIALAGAHAVLEKDIIYRRWVASHGGVYVPATKETPPNSYLANIEERNVFTASGKKLTLVNPAYMIRQMYELESERGTKGHITSLKPIRPENAPDEWEREALKAFEEGVTEYSFAELIDGKKHMRLMQPVIIEKGCLGCHTTQGYNLGDIGGGVSVSIPMEPLLGIATSEFFKMSAGHISLWLLGLIGIAIGSRSLTSKINERNLAEELLSVSEEKFSKAFHLSPHIMMLIDMESRRRIEVNDTFVKVTGYSRKEILESSLSELNIHVDKEKANAALNLLPEKQSIRNFKSVILTKQGQERTILFSGEMLDIAGKKCSLITGKDITDHIKAEMDLKRHQYYLGKAQEIGNIGTWELDVTNNILLWTEENYKIFGIPVGTNLTYETFLGCLHPEDKGYVHTEWMKAVDGQPYDIEHRIIANGKTKWVREKAELLFNDKGAVTKAVGVTQDITDRKLAEGNAEGLAHIIETSRNEIYIFDANTLKFVQANEGARNNIGYDIDELQRLTPLDIKPGISFEYLAELVEPLRTHKEQIINFQTLHKRKDGTMYPAEVHLQLSSLNSRQVFVAFILDITIRKHAETKLKERMHLVQTLLDNMPCIAILMRPQSREIIASNKIAAMTGAVPGKNKHCYDTWAQRKTPCPFCLANKAWDTNSAQTLEIEWNGTWWDAHWVPISEDLYMHYAFDITERKHAEQNALEQMDELAHASRLASMGQMATGLAHEINQPLCAITSFADAGLRMLKSEKFASKDVIETMQSVSTQAYRAGEIIKNLRTFINKVPVDFSVIDVCKVIENSIVLAQGAINQRHTKVTLALPEEPLLVSANQVQIEQVMINLIQNSLEAMDQTEISKRKIAINASKTNDELIVVAVTDSGGGCSNIDPLQIFNPFFTTKEEGMGIGLCINTSIIEEHKGQLWLEQNEDGTTFKFTIPTIGKGCHD